MTDVSETPRQPRPEWLRVRLRTGENYRRLRSMVSELDLNTVCAEARCPIIYECWNAGTATFRILGEVCTRRCGFCNVTSGRPQPGVDAEEPRHVAEAVARLGLRHAVITSVDRDDLPDGGGAHFALATGLNIDVGAPGRVLGSLWRRLQREMPAQQTGGIARHFLRRDRGDAQHHNR